MYLRVACYPVALQLLEQLVLDNVGMLSRRGDHVLTVLTIHSTVTWDSGDTGVTVARLLLLTLNTVR